jgi:hypothetical protein
MIKQFADRHDLAHMVVVADAGMLSVTNLRELDRARLLAVSASWSSCGGWSGVNVTAAAQVDRRRASECPCSPSAPGRPATRTSIETNI